MVAAKTVQHEAKTIKTGRKTGTELDVESAPETLYDFGWILGVLRCRGTGQSGTGPARRRRSAANIGSWSFTRKTCAHVGPAVLYLSIPSRSRLPTPATFLSTLLALELKIVRSDPIRSRSINVNQCQTDSFSDRPVCIVILLYFAL